MKRAIVSGGFRPVFAVVHVILPIVIFSLLLGYVRVSEASVLANLLCASRAPNALASGMRSICQQHPACHSEQECQLSPRTAFVSPPRSSMVRRVTARPPRQT
ncbi:MAG TPA: hypothetical protein VEW28_00775 [Candidatus Kapabacteria bacterium]|nr:hypothetical protein [Candidatus Kapabacteria bacterium]